MRLRIGCTSVSVALALASVVLPARAEESKSWLEDGIFPKSLKIPGTNVSVAFGGYAKVDFIQDLDSVGNAFEFKTNSIAIDGTAAADLGGQTTVHVRETRLNLDLRSNEPTGGFRVFVEGDFFGDNGSFRIRHAYGEYKRILGGQTWSTFQDFSARPMTVDYEGPDAEIFIRQPMVRYTMPIADHWTWAIAVESPGSQIDVLVPLTGTERDNLPDLPTYFRFEKPRGHVQLAAIVRQIRFDGQSGSPDLTTTAWGANATFKVKTVGQDELMGQFAYGEGIGRYVEAFSGLGSDAAITSATDIETLPATAFVAGYIHHWSKTLKSGVSYGQAELDTLAGQPGSTTSQIQDARLNLIYTPYHLVDFGFEALWGRHETADGSSGDAVRLQMGISYRFN